MEDVAISCKGFRALISSSACERNRLMAVRAAKLIWAGMGLKAVSWLDVDRMMVCGRCEAALIEIVGECIRMEEVYKRVRDEIVEGWRKVEEDWDVERHDPEVIAVNKKEHYKRWREGHIEWSRERQRLWRLKKKEEAEKEKQRRKDLAEAQFIADMELGAGPIIDVGKNSDCEQD